ncbi:MAG: DUF1836 domain-containing protein [Candidatus Ventricola sp.]
MEQMLKDQINASIHALHLPAYQEIPDVGLYLEQTAKYISDALAPIQDTPITGSMISNYVKKGLIPKPVRKQYNREQIAQLIFIAVAKSVVSMDDLGLMLSIQRKTYSLQVAYDYFRDELYQMLTYVFSRKGEMDALDTQASEEKVMLRNAIVTVAHKIYLDKLFAVLRADEQHKTDGK